MKAQYKKYLDALRGKDFSAPAGQYTSALSNATSSLSSAETLINSSVWIEKGLEIIKESVLPSLKSQMSQLEAGLSALSQVGGKVSELVSACEALENLENELNSTLPRWSYVEGGTKSKDQVSSHNNKITELETQITNQEGAIDGIVASINGISVTYNSASASFAGIMTNLKESTDLEAQRLAFIGSIDDDSYHTDPNYTRAARQLTLFDNATGRIFGEGDTITIKKGERRVITVKLPTDAGHIDEIIRTSAWKDKNCTTVDTYSDVNPDPNKVEYVNFHNNHYPEDRSVLHSNYYEWIIEGTETGEAHISQTCLFKREEGGPCPKAMVDIHVKVV